VAPKRLASAFVSAKSKRRGFGAPAQVADVGGVGALVAADRLGELEQLALQRPRA
jgi:hypothetical protein